MHRNMTIGFDERWQFYISYHNEEYIQSHDARNKVVLKEKRESSEYRLHNKAQQDLVVYKIDGGLIKTNNQQRCDYGIYTEQDVLYLIELKGGDYSHALEQISSSIDILLKKPDINVKQLNARIVLSKCRTPDILTTQEKKLNNLLKNKYGHGNILKKTRLLEDII